MGKGIFNIYLLSYQVSTSLSALKLVLPFLLFHFYRLLCSASESFHVSGQAPNKQEGISADEALVFLQKKIAHIKSYNLY